MFFLIRCVFWLTVVFTTIFGNQAPATHPEHAQQAAEATNAARSDSGQQLGRAAQSWVTGALAHLWSGTAASCDGAPARCLSLAERLTEFARRHAPPEPDSTSSVSAWPANAAPASRFQRVAQVTAQATVVPLPPLRPQRLSPRPGPGGHVFDGRIAVARRAGPRRD